MAQSATKNIKKGAYMRRYIKFDGYFQKQFEEPKTKEYSTGVAVVVDVTDKQFNDLLSMQKNGKEIELEEFTSLIKDSDQYIHEMSKLQSLFLKKTDGLKEMLADKREFTSGYIDKQSEVYEYMYQFAKAGAYDKATNKAIISANEQSKAVASDFVLLLNQVRNKIEAMISEGKDIDEILKQASMISNTTTAKEIKRLLANV